MFVALYGGDLAVNEFERALYWSGEFKSIEADRVFGRVRRRERLQSLGRLFGFGIPKTPAETAIDVDRNAGERNGGAAISIETVAGAVDPLTGGLGPVPNLKRRWKGLWRRLWAVDDLDSLPALSAVRGADGWYLTDAPRSVVSLAILRAKGVREVRIARVPDSAAVGRENVEPSYRLVEHERDYVCSDRLESRAV